MHRFRLRLLLVSALLCSANAYADEVRVAVAANFTGAMKQLTPAFETATGHKLLSSFGASGGLYAQIRHGAPFDVLLSADADYPKKLELAGEAVSGTRFTYAIGRLALWSPNPGYVDANGAVLRRGDLKRLAIANPKTAPYGAAAEQTLRKLGLWEQLQPRLVQGENVAQTMQFVYSGNATLGFVALAQVRALPLSSVGSYWLVPADMHAPLRQEAVLLKRANANTAARAFLAFLREPRTRAQLESLGYGVIP